jgi:hypothetical protein
VAPHEPWALVRDRLIQEIKRRPLPIILICLKPNPDWIGIVVISDQRRRNSCPEPSRVRSDGI